MNRLLASVAIVLLSAPCAFPPAAGAAESLAGRVQRLEDTKQIHDLLIRYGLLLDGKDFKGYSELFSRDAVWVGGFGTHSTPAGIEAMLVKYMGPAAPGTRNRDNFHLLTNEIIEVDGDRAKAVSKLIFYVKSPLRRRVRARERPVEVLEARRAGGHPLQRPPGPGEKAMTKNRIRR